MRARMLVAVAIFALLTAAFVATGRQAAAGERLFNGDFSQGKDGWTPQRGLDFHVAQLDIGFAGSFCLFYL